MTRPSSALTEIGGFGLVTAAVSVCATLGVVLALPEPQAPRMTAGTAAAVLRGDPTAGEAAMIRRIDREPVGSRAVLIEAVVAKELGASQQNVRAVWTTADVTTSRHPPSFTMRVPREQFGDKLQEGPSPRVVIDPADLVPQLLVLEAEALLLQAPQAPFKVGLRRPDGKWWVAEVATPFWSGWRLRLLVACAACLLLVAPLTWLFAQRITRPLRQLAARVATPQQTREPARGPKEVRDVAEAIDTMRDRLAGEAAERVRMVAAVAHDLRTPLTSIRLRAERIPPEVRERIVDDIVRMEEMIGHVLDFAQADALSRRTVNLQRLVQERVSRADYGSRRLRLVSGPDLFVEADPLQIDRALDNLLQNAIFYAGGAVVAVTSTAGFAVLTVSDTGPGIAATDRARLLAPFVRGEASRNRNTGGAGLGLSIVSDIALRHGGSLKLGDNVGGGTIAEVHLPLPR